MKKDKLLERYIYTIGDTHLDGVENQNFANPKVIDYWLREFIGKTDDIRVAACSHNAIINREMVGICRVCQKPLTTGVGRWNDYLILRHPQCLNPICLDCAENNPDDFYKAFSKGLKKYELFREL